MLRITISQSCPTEEALCSGLSILIPDEQAPALRSALDELRTLVGSRLEEPHLFAKEDALTRAAAAIGTLAAGINRVVPEDDPYYG